jgi:hypothetical protein
MKHTIDILKKAGFEQKSNMIYLSFIDKIGDGWITPYNKNKFQTCGEYTLCSDLHEIGLMIRKKEGSLIKFKLNL